MEVLVVPYSACPGCSALRVGLVRYATNSVRVCSCVRACVWCVGVCIVCGVCVGVCVVCVVCGCVCGVCVVCVNAINSRYYPTAYVIHSNASPSPSSPSSGRTFFPNRSPQMRPYLTVVPHDQSDVILTHILTYLLTYLLHGAESSLRS